MKSAGRTVLDVLIVDDSAVVRRILTDLLSPVADLQVSAASDPLVAMTKMRRRRPHVILLDLEMPRMDGLTFLKQIMATDPLPVVVCSGFAGPGTELALRALAAGAVDIVAKPRVSLSGATEDNGLIDVVRAAAQARVGPRRLAGATGRYAAAVAEARRARGRATSQAGMPARFPAGSDAIVALGASTGGTEALREILCAMPSDGPGMVIVQHMPAGFTAAFAEHLNGMCRIAVREAAPGDRVTPGCALVAPGNRHMRVRRRGGDLVVALDDDPPICRHRPSVDALFRSVAEAAGDQAVGVILTGMGADGGAGLLEMKKVGASTIAQDESTSVVFGMPKNAVDLGAVDVILPLPRIASGILQRLPARADQARRSGG
jgi:two-component system chemotaxis response regulator CheB